MSEMLHGCLPDTAYFEMTARTGYRYGVWVTTPPGYAGTADTLPLVYVVDGNFAVGLTAPLIVTQVDPYLRIAPYIQVTIGYAGEGAADWAQLRNRDLVPPGEPVGEEVLATLRSAREQGTMTQQQAEAYLATFADTRADLFLEFLTAELHPRVQSQWRVSESGHGLFGYSYGGLLALYAWLREIPLFATFGAGTPGVASASSQIFALLESPPNRHVEAGGARLHVTLNELEILGDVPIYRRMASNVLSVIDELRGSGRSPRVTSALLAETHVTGLQASFLSYLKTCRPR